MCVWEGVLLDADHVAGLLADAALDVEGQAQHRQGQEQHTDTQRHTQTGEATGAGSGQGGLGGGRGQAGRQKALLSA